jgi:muramidase (phage lysozyme)
MTSNSTSNLSRPRTNDVTTSVVDGARGTDRHLRPPSPSSPEAPATRRAGRPGRRLGVLAGAVVLLVTLTGCNLPVSQWVPDFNKDGKIDQTEIDRQTKVIAESMAKGLESQRRQTQLHPFLVCVRRHESDRGAYPHLRGYTAQNPRSSASGAYQFIDGSWRTLSARAGYPGYARAKQAPWFVQDAVALHTFKNGGRGHWNGTGC